MFVLDLRRLAIVFMVREVCDKMPNSPRLRDRSAGHPGQYLFHSLSVVQHVKGIPFRIDIHDLLKAQAMIPYPQRRIVHPYTSLLTLNR